jgi:hypothetical protein
MSTYSDLMLKITLSNLGAKIRSKTKFKGYYYDSKTHICSASDVEHRVQRTDVFINTDGSYIFSAHDMGWNHPFWTKMRADSLAEAAGLLPYQWERIEIPNYLENHLITSLLEDGTKYIIIRNHTETELKSVVFIARPSIENGINIDSAIEDTLVFAPHVKGKSVERLVFSPSIEDELKLARTKSLVQRAQDSFPHILCEGLPNDIDFIHRLNAYLQADNMLINGDSSQDKITLVGKTGLVNDDDLLGLAKLMFNTPVNLSNWEMEFSYRGLPKMQTDRLKNDQDYTISEHKLWAKATRITSTSNWDTDLGFPSGEETCPEQSWLIG